MQSCGEMLPVESSCLKRVGFNPSQSTLCVEFLDGSAFKYLGVPESVYQGLLLSSSKGHYFDAYIKSAGYASVRLR